jgi:flagellar basal-body rod protein FlgB
MLNSLDQFFASRVSALDLRARRSELLASNVANADTPNYKARDFDFTQALQSALSGRRSSGDALQVDRTAPAHLAGVGGGAGDADVKYRVPVQSSIDGNTVELDTELGQFTDNAVRFQADLTFVSSQIRLLQIAIQGQ